MTTTIVADPTTTAQATFADLTERVGPARFLSAMSRLHAISEGLDAFYQLANLAEDAQSVAFTIQSAIRENRIPSRTELEAVRSIFDRLNALEDGDGGEHFNDMKSLAYGGENGVEFLLGELAIEPNGDVVLLENASEDAKSEAIV